MAQSEDKGPTRSELEWYYYTKGGGSPHRYSARCIMECGGKTRAPSKICSRCKKTSLKSFTLKKLQIMAEAFGLKKPSTKKVAIKRIKGWLKKQPTIRPASEVKGLKTGFPTTDWGEGQITEDEIIISRADTHYIYAFHRADDVRPDEYMAFIVAYHNNGTFTFSLADMSGDSSVDSSTRSELFLPSETITTDPYVVIHNNMEFTPRLPEMDFNLDYGDNIISFGPQNLGAKGPRGRNFEEGEYIPSPIAESIKEMGVDIYLQNPITGDILKFFTVYFTEILGAEAFYIDVVAKILDVENGKYELSAMNRPSGWRAESEVVSGKRKGKVISLIGSDPRLRKLTKDKDITPEEAATRLEISAEPNYNYNIGPYDGQEEQTPREFGAETCPTCSSDNIGWDLAENHPMCNDCGGGWKTISFSAEAGSFRDGTGCISKGSFPSMTCEYCGFDPHTLVYYQCKQNDEDLTWDEWKEELEFYFYEGSHAEQCQGLINEMDAETEEQITKCPDCGSRVQYKQGWIECPNGECEWIDADYQWSGAEHIWEPDQNARMCPRCHEQSLYTVMRTFDVCANQPLCNYDENAYDSKYPEGFGAETKVEAIQECLFCPESEGLVEIDIEGYPEYICEYCLDPTNWGEEEGWEAENWSGDPDGILAKALAKARDKMKERKSLNITKLPDPNQKTLDEFNGAVVWKEPKGIVEKVMVREMAMQQLALSEAILELEQYIRLGMISEEEAFRKIVAMSQ